MIHHVSMDLDRYFERIGFAGEVKPTLDVLRQLHERHPLSIPFEGLGPFIGERVSLNARDLQNKLVVQRRGGYCFEHNVLFWEVLRKIGFSVRGLSGRVRLNWPDDVILPRGHIVLLVSLSDGQYIADVGFGGLTLTAPLRFEIGVEQRTPHEPARLMEMPEKTYGVQVKVAEEWKTLYSFELNECHLVDYEVMNWYQSTHPQSPFVSGLIMAKVEKDKRRALRNKRYAVHALNGRSEIRELTSPGELIQTLERDFGLPLDLFPSDTLSTSLSRLFPGN